MKIFNKKSKSPKQKPKSKSPLKRLARYLSKSRSPPKRPAKPPKGKSPPKRPPRYLYKSRSPLKRPPPHLPKPYSPKPKGMQCKVDTLPKKTIYVVYTTETVPDHMMYESNTFTEDVVGIFTEKSDAVKVTKCINNLYKDESELYNWFRNKYRLIGYKFGEVLPDGIDNASDGGGNNNVYIVYNEYETGHLRDLYKFYSTFRSYKDKILPYYVERLIGVADTLEKAKHIKAEYISEFEQGQFNINPKARIEIQKFCTNELKPFKFFKDYNRYIHEKGAKTYLQDVKQYAQKQKMKGALEDIKFLKDAPPSKMLPKGGIGYREMISDPDFVKRWAPWDPKFKK